MIAGNPWLGASDKVTFLGTLNLYTFVSKYSRASFSIKADKEFLLSYIVKIIPFSFKSGFRLSLTASIVLINLERPSNAKNSHWTGIKTSLLAVRELIVSNPRVGGVSINI